MSTINRESDRGNDYPHNHGPESYEGSSLVDPEEAEERAVQGWRDRLRAREGKGLDAASLEKAATELGLQFAYGGAPISDERVAEVIAKYAKTADEIELS